MNRNEIVDRNGLMIMSIEDSLLRRSNKAVLSKGSAASGGGFSEVLDFKYNVTFPKGQNLKVDKNYFSVNGKANSKFFDGIETFNDGDLTIKVYCAERTIVELIKDAKGMFTDVLVKTIRNFFNNIKYNYNKLMGFAKVFNVEKEVLAFVAVNR